MKDWITKYALSKGLFQVEAPEDADSHGFFSVKDETFWTTYYHKKDWRANKGEAIGMAVEMRKKKIASLKKQIKKLEGLEF